jgi:SET domain-containing protein
MNAFDYINNHVFTRIKPSSISGIGVFAAKDIPEGTILFKEWDGLTGFYPISQEELLLLDDDIRRQVIDFFTYSTDFPNDTNIYVKLFNGCHWVHTTPYCFINSGFYENKSNVDKNTLKTIRPIKRGEELLSNYQRYEKTDKKLL